MSTLTNCAFCGLSVKQSCSTGIISSQPFAVFVFTGYKSPVKDPLCRFSAYLDALVKCMCAFVKLTHNQIIKKSNSICFSEQSDSCHHAQVLLHRMFSEFLFQY